MSSGNGSGFRPEEENVVYIGAGVTLKGEISVPDLIIVDGTVEGDVTARAVSVGQTGVIRGKIVATEADISGSITDHIEIKQLLIVRSTGRAEGRVMYGEIELEKGAIVTGDLSATDDYRAVAKPSSQDKGESVVAGPIIKTGTLERLDDAVRAAKKGAAQGRIYLAAKSEPARRNIPRTPISSRSSKD